METVWVWLMGPKGSPDHVFNGTFSSEAKAIQAKEDFFTYCDEHYRTEYDHVIFEDKVDKLWGLGD